MANLLGAGENQERVEAVLDQIDRDIRVYIRIKTTLAAITSALAYSVMASVALGARFSKRVVLWKNCRRTDPVGPLRCLAQMTSARP